jgi:RTX calcium-binding nonapeptide repeat (4 copies)
LEPAVRVAILCALLIFACSAPPAAAGTASAGDECHDKAGCFSNVSFHANPGEANDVRLATDGATVTVYDAGAPLVVGEGCAPTGDGGALCRLPTGTIKSVSVLAGDGNDRVAVRASGVVVATNLDDGDDMFTGDGVARGDAGDDRLAGGDSDNDLDGGLGADVVLGSGGNDRIGAGDGQNDALDGGPGRDLVSYVFSRAGVSVDLAAGIGGRPGERDTLAGMEDVDGSEWADVLAGDAGPNRLRAFQGTNRLSGRGGDDLLAGGAISDCGAGRDAVQADHGHATAVACERWRFEITNRPGLIALPRRARRGRLTVVVPCPLRSTGPPLPCHVRLELRDARGAVARARAHVDRGARRRLTLRGPAHGGRVRLALLVTDDLGRQVRAAVTFPLRG